MAENTKNRLTGMLLSKSRRARYIRTFVVLAACVAIAVAVALHQSGIAMTHEEQILTCPVSGVVAHTHNESCYDADGNLVCALPEIELHTHGDDCYTEVKELTCGLEESDEHKHTDACYTVTRKLTCGKEEVTEEHVHGPGCFTTVTVGEAETQSEGTKPQVVVTGSMPAQKFEDKIMDDKGNEWVHVTVNAPEGAFPEGTTMRITPLDAESVRNKVEEAIKKDDETIVAAKQMKAVDITFYDAQGNEIEPATQVEVKITSDTVSSIKDPVLVHVNKDEAKSAEVVQKVDVVNQNEEDTTKDSKDTLKFESTSFSPYVIVEVETIVANVITASGEKYEISVSYGTDAGIPAGAILEATEVVQGSENYDACANETAQALNTDVQGFDHMRMFDITIKDAQGNKLEPKAQVEVKINCAGEGIESDQELKVVHLAKDGAEVITPEAKGNGDSTDTVTFTTDSFSIYSVVSWKVTGDLSNKTLSIVHVSTTSVDGTSVDNDSRHWGRAMQATIDGDKLIGANVVVEQHEGGMNVVDSNSKGERNYAPADQIAAWTFEKADSNNSYYLRAGSQYLKLTQSGKNGGSLSMVSQKQDATKFTVEEGSGANAGMVCIRVGDRYLRSSISRGTNKQDAANPRFVVGAISNDHIWFSLCEIELTNPNEGDVYTGYKVGSTQLADGGSYMIYKNVFNPNTGNYEDYIIDGNGNLVRAYDKGDSITLHSVVSPEWKLIVCLGQDGTPSGYYVFVNESTNTILHPLSDGTLVKSSVGSNVNTDGVSMEGRKNGNYTSTIEYWNDSVNEYYGYKIVNSELGLTLQSAKDSESQDFSFAEIRANEGQLHTVETVDSASKGIHIHMFDYPSRSYITEVTGANNGSNDYNAGVLHNGFALPTLSANGYPQFKGMQNDASKLFSTTGNQYYKGTANKLFLASIYNSTGYYEYSCFNNFAHYDEASHEFTVYSEQGTPAPTSSNFYYKRGNFMPFNSLNTKTTAQNLYNGDGDLLDYNDPSNDYNGTKTLYGLNATNFSFGMTMDFEFMMPRQGYMDGNPLIYEFNGDDDLLVYVDGVLLLDIGGVHDAWSGKINFATGEITGKNVFGAGKATNIRDCFKNAHIFPDGTEWVESRANEYFNGNTFVDYSSHTFNMFYMEHGEGASNLETRFNLPVIKQGDVVVKKELSNTDQTKYANVRFAYQLFTKDSSGKETALREAKYESTGQPIEFNDNVTFWNGETYDNVFYLKPNEAAVFSNIPQDQEYYVREIGVKSDYYDEVTINEVQIDNEHVDKVNGVYSSTYSTPKNRARVTFNNRCDENNSNMLLITKRLAEGTQHYNDTFEFRVMLENANGELVPYSEGEYWIRDDDGKCYKYENGKLVDNGYTPYKYKTGVNGTIANIPADYTIAIDGLLAGTDFRVEEIRTKRDGTNQYVDIDKSDWKLVSRKVAEGTFDAADNSSPQNSLGMIALGKDAQIVFTNRISAREMLLQKVDNNKKPIAGTNGAQFEFAWHNGETWSSVTSDLLETTGDKAIVDLGTLRPGLYRLEEKAAPSGYNILENKYVYFEVYTDKSGNVTARIVNVAQDGKVTPVTDENVAYVTQVDNKCTIAIKNIPGNELPQTGGTGTTVFYVAGGSLVAAGLVYWFSRKRFARHGA